MMSSMMSTVALLCLQCSSLSLASLLALLWAQQSPSDFSATKRLTQEDIVQSTSITNDASMPEMRSLTATEIDQTAGGVIWIPPLVIAAATMLFLHQQRKQ
jgi:hypothetical protein